MSTPLSRPTYAGWLDEIGRSGRSDDPGLVASAWLAARDHGRPRLSAVRSVNQWLAAHGVPGVQNLNAALHALEQGYHSADGLPPAATAVQPVQAAPPMPTFQPPMAPQQPVQAALPWPEQQQAAPPAVPAGQEPAQPAVPEHPWQVVMLALGRIEAWMTALAPLAQLAAEAGMVNAAIDASALVQPSEAQQRVQQIAADHGWTAGPAFADQQPAQAAVGFYGNHVVAQPDFAAMADASDGTEEGGE